MRFNRLALVLLLPSAAYAQQRAAAPVAASQPQPAASPLQPAASPPASAQPAPALPAGATPPVGSEPTQAASRVLTLSEALQAGHAHQPVLRQARATTDVSRARVGQARAPLLPQVTTTAAYQRKTLNFVPGALANTGAPTPTPNFNTYNFFNFGLTANQLVYDFGQSWKRHEAAEVLVDARKDDEQATEILVAQNVRIAFFNARAAKALVAVAHETYDNFARHLWQIEGFVRAGTRAEIDLAQARTDRANAQVGVINAENAYASAKATLNQAMGVETYTDYDVSDDGLPEIAGENGSLQVLVQQAWKARPEFASFDRQLRSLDLTLSSIKGGYFPSLGVSTGLTEGGSRLNSLAWNWNAGATLTWQLFSGGLTDAQADEARANLVSLQAQAEILRQQVLVDVEQARLAVRATKAVLVASDDVVTNARERLRLAEGRYAIGVGNGIELADAQLALASALAQGVQAEYNLAAARAGLLHALGLP
jgi:outer membrane protein